MKITWRDSVTGSIEGTVIEFDRTAWGYAFYLIPFNEKIGEIELPPGEQLSDEEIIEQALAFGVSAELEGKV
jgi:hypothetical protein